MDQQTSTATDDTNTATDDTNTATDTGDGPVADRTETPTSTVTSIPLDLI
ncbi:hypothetical protein ACW14Y_42630 (plasmid) [Kitasatospora sp. cg17-2]